MGCLFCDYSDFAISECDGVYTVRKITNPEERRLDTEGLLYDMAYDHIGVIWRILWYYIKIRWHKILTWLKNEWR